MLPHLLKRDLMWLNSLVNDKPALIKEMERIIEELKQETNT